MADIVDMASGLEAGHLARSLSHVARDIPQGQAGVCDECDEHRGRLVDGRCGYCRDGREPPPSTFDDPPTPPSQEECPPVANPAPSDNFQIVSIRARDDVLDAIRTRSEADGTSLASAAFALIEKGARIAGLDIPASETAKRDGEPETLLAYASVDDLLSMLRDRVARSADADDLRRALDEASDLERAATARAEMAEARAVAAEGAIASLRDALKGLVS